jgi:flagellar hook-associated protein 1 FlgK
MSINRILDQGKGALAATQLGLSTTSHNISNTNTKGYSRQRVDFNANEPVTNGRHRVGSGVGVGAISRTVSPFVNKRIEEESSDMGQYEGLSEIYTQLETVVGDSSDTGISARMGRFFNDIRSLSTEPSSVPLRSAVRESADSLTSRFQALRGNLESMVSDLDRRIEGGIGDVNALTNRIAELNQRIVDVEVNKGSNANDERDARDQAVRELAKLMPVQTTDLENGAIAISSSRAGVLVDASGAYKLVTQREPHDFHSSALRIYSTNTLGKASKDVTNVFDTGAIGGYVKARDTVLPGVTGRLDTLAFGFAKAMNSVHGQGYGTDGSTNKDIFAMGQKDAHRAAANLKMSDDLMDNIGALASAHQPNAPSDNRGLLDLANLQDAKLFEGGKASMNEYLSGIVGTVGVETRAMRDSLETQGHVMEQLDTLREEVSGVSLDEEAIEMLKFQKAFDANAKMIQVADSMMETVLSLKRF